MALKSPELVRCPRCNEPHVAATAKSNHDTSRAYTSWLHAEEVRQRTRELPLEAVGPLQTGAVYDFNVYEKKHKDDKPAVADHTLSLTWDEYYAWLLEQAQRWSGIKGHVAVTNLTSNGRRSEHNQRWQDRVYFDCDDAGDYLALVDVFAQLGIAAIVHESSSSVLNRVAQGDWQNELLPTRWHFEVPLTERIPNRFVTSDRQSPTDEEWLYYRQERKNQYRHVAAVLSALAGFGGVGGHCGFDLATSQLAAFRFLGVAHEGVMPVLFMIEGDGALDWNRLLDLTGYEPLPRQEPKPPTLESVVYEIDGKVREAWVAKHDGRIYDDVKARLSVRQLLEQHLGLSPTAHSGGLPHYFCPVHGEASNPDGLREGPNRRGFHVHMHSGQQIEIATCLGNCQRSWDVISLAGAVWGMGNHQAALKLAEAIGLDMGLYDARRVQRPTQPAPDGWESAFADEPETDWTGAPVTEEEDLETGDPGAEAEPEAPDPNKIELYPERVCKIWVPKGCEDLVPPPKPPRAKTKEVPFAHLADWAEKYMYDLPDPMPVLRAATCTLLQGPRKRRKPGEEQQEEEEKKFKPKIDPERIAASFFTALWSKLERTAIDGEILVVLSRLQQDRPVHGKRWLERNLGLNALWSLSHASYRDYVANRDEYEVGAGIRSTIMDYMFQHITCRPYRGDYEREFLNELCYDVRAKKAKADAEAAKKLTSAEILACRSMACMSFGNSGKTNFGRDIDRRKILCESRMCVYCNMVKAAHELEILWPKWKTFYPDGEFHQVSVVRVTIPRLDDMDSWKEALRGVGRGKVLSIGVDDRLRPHMLMVFKDSTDSSYALGKLDVWRALQWRDHKNREAQRPEYEYERFDCCLEEAMNLSVANKLSTTIRAAELVRTHDKERLAELLGWVHRRHLVIARGAGALPWVSGKELEEAKPKRDHQLAEGEEIRWTLVHLATEIELGSKDRPFKIDEAVRIGSNSMKLRDELRRRRREQERSAPRARAPVG